MNEVIQNIDLSAYSIEELSALVERANKEIQHKEQNRVLDVRSQIEQLAGSLNMSVDEVLQYDLRRRRTPKSTPGKPKFQNPDNPDQTWTGRGKRPRWLQDRLDQGASLEDFAIG